MSEFVTCCIRAKMSFTFNNANCVSCCWIRLRHSSGPQSGRNSWGSSSHSERPRKSAEAAAVDSAAPNRHIAKSHDDTTEGAVHCFQDEFGLHPALLCRKFIPVLQLYFAFIIFFIIYSFACHNCHCTVVALRW